jgi:hypothetical protein
MARPQPSALALRLGSAPLVIPEIEADNVELNGLLAGRRRGDALQHELHLKLSLAQVGPGSSRPAVLPATSNWSAFWKTDVI